MNYSGSSNLINFIINQLSNVSDTTIDFPYNNPTKKQIEDFAKVLANRVGVLGGSIYNSFWMSGDASFYIANPKILEEELFILRNARYTTAGAYIEKLSPNKKTLSVRVEPKKGFDPLDGAVFFTLSKDKLKLRGTFDVSKQENIISNEFLIF